MNRVYAIIQIVVSVFIIISILLQSQGDAFTPGMQGGGEDYHTKQGIEKVFFYLTAIAVIIFVINSVLLSVY